MKVSRILCLCAAVALPQFAAAESAADAQGMAIVQAVLSFCAKVDPKNAASFQAQERNVVPGGSEKQLESVRESGAYKQAFKSITDVLEELPRSAAAQTCAAGATSTVAIRKKDD